MEFENKRDDFYRFVHDSIRQSSDFSEITLFFDTLPTKQEKLGQFVIFNFKRSSGEIAGLGTNVHRIVGDCFLQVFTPYKTGIESHNNLVKLIFDRVKTYRNLIIRNLYVRDLNRDE